MVFFTVVTTVGAWEIDGMLCVEDAVCRSDIVVTCDGTCFLGVE